MYPFPDRRLYVSRCSRHDVSTSRYPYKMRYSDLYLLLHLNTYVNLSGCRPCYIYIHTSIHTHVATLLHPRDYGHLLKVVRLYKRKEMHTCFFHAGSYWPSGVSFGTTTVRNIFAHWFLLCKDKY